MTILPLMTELLNGLLQTEENFYSNPHDLESLEECTRDNCTKFARKFMEMVLSNCDKLICENVSRNGKYTIQRHDTRTLITTVGDVIYNHTLFKKKEDNTHHYLTDEMIGLEKHERFSVPAETTVLTEAVKTSYLKAASKLPSSTGISKTTVMNKVHQIVETMPFEEREEKRKCRYLYIEADEDHIAEQHGRYGINQENKGMIGRLAYVYEDKIEAGKKRRILTETFYFGGLYVGSRGVRQFWEKVDEYIQKNYDDNVLETVYISGDGAAWIKASTDYVSKSVMCIDRFHLMKYINKAAKQMLDEEDIVKQNIYRMLYKEERSNLKKYFKAMTESSDKENIINETAKYINNNWTSIMRTLHDKNTKGCSAEGHVSHMLSERLSSRPIRWSQNGADSMCQLRCYVKNYGQDKVIDLVRYNRSCRKLKRTGTDDSEISETQKYNIIIEHESQNRSYIERIQAHIAEGNVKKKFAIRNHLYI